jgi:hypothetical protein
LRAQHSIRIAGKEALWISELVDIHSNMPGAVPPEVSRAIAAGGSAPPNLTSDERTQFEKLKSLFAKGVYYAFEMATRPQTLYGIADSPIGLASWLTVTVFARTPRLLQIAAHLTINAPRGRS